MSALARLEIVPGTEGYSEDAELLIPRYEGVAFTEKYKSVLRHGPAPANRRIFDVTAEETIELALRNGLKEILYAQTESVQPTNREAGVMWTWLAFRK